MPRQIIRIALVNRSKQGTEPIGESHAYRIAVLSCSLLTAYTKSLELKLHLFRFFYLFFFFSWFCFFTSLFSFRF